MIVTFLILLTTCIRVCEWQTHLHRLPKKIANYWLLLIIAVTSRLTAHLQTRYSISISLKSTNICIAKGQLCSNVSILSMECRLCACFCFAHSDYLIPTYCLWKKNVKSLAGNKGSPMNLLDANYLKLSFPPCSLQDTHIELHSWNFPIYPTLLHLFNFVYIFSWLIFFPLSPRRVFKTKLNPRFL